MKFISYKEVEDAFSEKCFPMQSGLDTNQKKFFLSYFKEAMSEVWNKFDWDFAVDIELYNDTKDLRLIDTADLDEAGESRILQVWDKHPYNNLDAKNLSFKQVNGVLYFAKAIKTSSVYIKYKRNVPLVSVDISVPLFFKAMLLSLCAFHWQGGQGRDDLAQIALANFERYAQSEIAKQPIASVYGNSINQRTRQ